MSSTKNIIVALDGMDGAKALALAATLQDEVWGFKVNDLLVQQGLGIVSALKEYGSVFADPKLHDIPNTVANGVSALSKAGADLITVHASGGLEMCKAAVQAAKGAKILAVTVLTSLNDAGTVAVFGANVQNTVKRLAGVAAQAGIHGLVSSPQELGLLEDYPALLKVTPGVRPLWHQKPDDQARTLSPQEAFARGATHLVIGRPITGHPDPLEAVHKIAAEL